MPNVKNSVYPEPIRGVFVYDAFPYLFYVVHQKKVSFIQELLIREIRMGMMKEQKEAWKNISGSIDVLLIIGHSQPLFVANMSSDAVAKLPDRDIKIVFIVGCNAGHYDYADNVALVMSRKVTGCVIASDGTVQTYFGTELLLKTIGDDTFIKYRNRANPGSNRRNYGWIMYKNGSRKKTIGLTNAKYSLARILREAGI